MGVVFKAIVTCDDCGRDAEFGVFSVYRYGEPARPGVDYGEHKAEWRELRDSVLCRRCFEDRKAGAA